MAARRSLAILYLGACPVMQGVPKSSVALCAPTSLSSEIEKPLLVTNIPNSIKFSLELPLKYYNNVVPGEIMALKRWNTKLWPLDMVKHHRIALPWLGAFV
jgi:hypothetical protein